MNEQEYQKALKEARGRLSPEYPNLAISLADYETRQHAVVAIREKQLKQLRALNAPDVLIESVKHLLQKEVATLNGTAFDATKEWKVVQERLLAAAE